MGLICAGKKIHMHDYTALINPGNVGAKRMVEKYYDECQLLSLQSPTLSGSWASVSWIPRLTPSQITLKFPVSRLQSG